MRVTPRDYVREQHRMQQSRRLDQTEKWFISQD